MKTYEEIAPARAAAKAADKIEPLWTDTNWVAEQKVDGWRFLMHLHPSFDRVYMTGRRVSSETGRLSEKGLCAPSLWPSTKALASLSGYTVLDGEVLPPDGRKFGDIAGIMNVTPDKAAQRIKQIGPPQYVVFDVLWYNGQDWRTKPWSHRKRAAETLTEALWYDNPNVAVLGHSTSGKRDFYDMLVETGHEGVILKHHAAQYGDGWIKVKRYSTLDVVITGYTEAKHGKTGKYDGLIGALVVSVWDGKTLVEVGQVSGMTDAERLMFSRHRDRYQGKVIEIAAQEMAKDRLRHPRYKRLRPEASARDATLRKLHADLKAATHAATET